VIGRTDANELSEPKSHKIELILASFLLGILTRAKNKIQE
jgi:hypothetical protein